MFSSHHLRHSIPSAHVCIRAFSTLEERRGARHTLKILRARQSFYEKLSGAKDKAWWLDMRKKMRVIWEEDLRADSEPNFTTPEPIVEPVAEEKASASSASASSTSTSELTSTSESTTTTTSTSLTEATSTEEPVSSSSEPTSTVAPKRSGRIVLKSSAIRNPLLPPKERNPFLQIINKALKKNFRNDESDVLWALFLENKVRNYLTSEQYDQMMQYFVTKRDFPRAIRLLRFLESNQRQTVKTYNTLLQGYIFDYPRVQRNRKVEERVTQLYARMKTDCFYLPEVTPNLETYELALTAYGNAKRARLVHKTLSLIFHEHEQHMDEVTYKFIIRAVAKINDFSAASRYLERMKEQGFVPDLETYHSILSVCPRNEKIFDYLQEMKYEQKLTATRKTFEILFGSLLASPINVEMILKLIDVMIDDYHQKPIDVYALVLEVSNDENFKEWLYFRGMQRNQLPSSRKKGEKEPKLDVQGYSFRLAKQALIYVLKSFAGGQTPYDLHIHTQDPILFMRTFKRWDPPLKFIYDLKQKNLLILNKHKLAQWLEAGGSQLLGIGQPPSYYFAHYKVLTPEEFEGYTPNLEPFKKKIAGVQRRLEKKARKRGLHIQERIDAGTIQKENRFY